MDTLYMYRTLNLEKMSSQNDLVYIYTEHNRYPIYLHNRSDRVGNKENSFKPSPNPLFILSQTFLSLSRSENCSNSPGKTTPKR